LTTKLRNLFHKI